MFSKAPASAAECFGGASAGAMATPRPPDQPADPASRSKHRV